MKLAIADPPYLGRANRWYGTGRGSGGGLHVADQHPDAALWDAPATHTALVERLVDEFDGWAIAASADSLPHYLSVTPRGVRVMVWHKRNAVPSGSRIHASWEPVLVYVPNGRRAHGSGPAVRDVLDSPNLLTGFAGAKPPAWTAWVLSALGHQEGDELIDLFPGSGAITEAIRGGGLITHSGRRA